MQVPESMKSTWENIKASNQSTGNITQEQLQQLGDAANADGIIDQSEQEFLNYVQSNLMTTSNSNQGKGSQPIEFVDPQFGKVPSSMVEVWKQASSDGIITEEELNSLKLAAAPNGKNKEFDNEEVSFLANLVESSQDGKVVLNSRNNNNISSNNANTPFGEVPSTLENAWNIAVSDGKISVEDLDQLILAATPNEDASEIDDKERSFLLKIKEALEKNNGNPVSLSNVSNSSSPTLLNWPGYTQQTKQALRNAYGNLVIGTKMPLLRSDVATQVANAFGVSNVRDLQAMIGAKVDGKFGPETFFKAKAFVANLMNSNPNDPRISYMLDVLGNDQEVQKMREKFTGNTNQNNTQNNNNSQNTQQVDNNKPPVSIGDTDPNNPESIKNFQDKVNLLISIYNKQKGTSFEAISVDGQLTESFADNLRNIEQTIGKPAAQMIAEIENQLKSKGFNNLNSRTTDFIKINDNNSIEIIGEPKDITRINAAKELLSKLGFNLTNFEVFKTQEPGKNGDIILKSDNFELAIFDNVSIDKRDHNKYGDIHIIGKYDNKNIDVSYWENDRRGEKSVKQFNRFHLRALVDGKEILTMKQNESILSKPLIQVKQ